MARVSYILCTVHCVPRLPTYTSSTILYRYTAGSFSFSSVCFASYFKAISFAIDTVFKFEPRRCCKQTRQCQRYFGFPYVRINRSFKQAHQNKGHDRAILVLLKSERGLFIAITRCPLEVAAFKFFVFSLPTLLPEFDKRRDWGATPKVRRVNATVSPRSISGSLISPGICGGNSTIIILIWQRSQRDLSGVPAYGSKFEKEIPVEEQGGNTGRRSRGLWVEGRELSFVRRGGRRGNTDIR